MIQKMLSAKKNLEILESVVHIQQTENITYRRHNLSYLWNFTEMDIFLFFAEFVSIFQEMGKALSKHLSKHCKNNAVIIWGWHLS